MPPPKLTYAEKLQDPRWQKKRLEIFNESKWACENCGRSMPSEGLQVHHILYLSGVEPWDHPNEILMCVCKRCHEERQPIEQQFLFKVCQVLRYKSPEDMQTMPVWWMFETKPFYQKDKK